MKKGTKLQNLEAVAEEEEEASKMSIDAKKKKPSSSRKSSKDKKEDKEKEKKDKKNKAKEPEVKDVEKDKAKLPQEDKKEKIEVPKDTISSVYNDLDQLSNHLAKTFTSFDAPKTMHARFFDEADEQRHNPKIRMPYNNYSAASTQEFNTPKGNYYQENRSHAGRYEEREKGWYDMSEKELLQRYMFREDDNRGETPFYDQNREYVHQPRFHDPPQQRNFHPSASTQGFSNIHKELIAKEETMHRNNFRNNVNLAQSADNFYNPMFAQSKNTPQAGRDIKELYRHQPRHFFVEQDIESSSIPDKRIPGRSPQGSRRGNSMSSSNLKNSGAVYVNRFFG